MKKNRGIIVFLIVVFGFGAIFDYYSDKTGERLTQDLIKADSWWQEQGVSKDHPVIFFVGTFMSVFDFKPVQQAAMNFSKQGVKCQFVLCGAGDYLDEVKVMMEGLTNVIFPGWIDKPEIEPTNAIKEELISFHNCIINDTKPIVSEKDGLKALKVAHKIQEKLLNH